MQNSVRPTLPSVPCDDKEKLRRKLALLQREYSRTVQRLKRAERSEAQRKHHAPSSSTTENILRDRCDPTGTPGSSSGPKPASHTVLVETACGGTVPPHTPQGQGHTGGPVESQNGLTISAVNLPLLSDDAVVFPLTPDPGGVDRGVARGGGYRSSPALRLRSRSSRLRWEKRWKEDSNNSEDGLEPSGKTAGASGGDGEDRGRTGGGEAEEEVNDSESESPSLLLTHWNTAGHGGEEEREQREERETATESGGEEGRNSRGRDGPSSLHQNRGEGKKTEEDERTVLGKSCGEEVGGGEEGRGVLLQDSCTLVEGLLFPVEYYVRTTRRMSSSRSHPDLQAVIHYQLSPGRRTPRGRGRGRGGGAKRALLHAAHQYGGRTDGLTASPASVDDPSPLEPAAGDRRSSGDVSVSQTSAGSSSSSVPCTSSAPVRGRGGGRRRGRGRGRGRGKRPSFGRSISLDGATEHLLPAPSSPSLLPPPPPPSQPSSSTVDRPEKEECHLVSQAAPAAAAPVVPPCRSQSPLPVTSMSPADQQPPCGADQPPCGVDQPPWGVEQPKQDPPASGRVEEKIYPIFTKTRPANDQTPQLNRASWWSLLLPPQPSPLPPPLSPLLPLGPGGLLLKEGLASFDLQQDFHLPDEQFASLKLHKLRRAAATEAFSSPSYNTRHGARRRYYTGDQPPTPLALPLSPTPPVTADPPDTDDGGRRRRRSTQQRSVVDLQRSPSFSPILHFTDHHHATTANLSDNNVVMGDSSDGSAEELPRVIQSLQISTGELKDCPPSEAVHSEPPQQQGCREDPSQTWKDSDRPREEAPEPDHLNLSRLTKDTSSSSQCLIVHGLGGDSQTLHGHRVERAPPSGHHHHHAPSQLLLSPSLASPPWGGTAGPPSLPLPSLGPTPPPPPLAPGRQEGRRRDLMPPPPLISSPSALPLLSPFSTQTRSPPLLSSPGPSLNHLLPALTPPSPQPSPSPGPSPGCCTPVRQVQVSSCHLPAASTNQCQRIAAPTSSPPLTGSNQPQGSMGTIPVVTSDGGEVERSQGWSEHGVMTCTHTLKTPAGGPLVDACCVWRGGPPGEEECVAVAGKWAVCVWEQTSTADWSMTNTWTFCEPVISVFAVPDAAGLLCVALGQLEIREVRMLSCSGLSQTLLCEGVVHSIVGVANSRVVSSSPSATGSTLKLFHFSEDSSSEPAPQSLVAPGVCVGTLATVDGLSDALIGSADGGHLFLWNLHSGQLLRRISLGQTLSNTVCLNGYSHSGVLFVLLQHQLLNSMEEVSDGEGGGVVCAEEDEEESGMKKRRRKKKTVLFSVVAVNPLTGKSLLATQLYQPEAWSGRLCEADVMGSSVVGLSQNGRVCVWELGGRGHGRGGGGGPGSSSRSHLVWAPEGDGWQLARWGRQNTLLTGHHNGDLTLYRYRSSDNPTTVTTNHDDAPPC